MSDGLDAGFDALDPLDLDPAPASATVKLTGRIERLARRMRSKQIDVAEAVESSENRTDGHASVRAMVGHIDRLSEPEARLPGPGAADVRVHVGRDDRLRRGTLGAPACGRHNQFKENGFTVYRDERGRMHILRPDGTEIAY